MQAATIIKAVESVTKKWTKQRKAEERGRSSTTRRAVFVRMYRMSIKDAAWKVLDNAYAKVSDNGRLPAQARQIYYAARPAILEMTGRDDLKSQYFTQTILPAYMAENGDTWDVVYDARGHFAEPHTKRIVGLGTLEVREYLAKMAAHNPSNVSAWDFLTDEEYPTCGPEHRFSAVVFIEKEGFLPLFEAVDLAERYDIAIMSTKGMPVVACRHLADELCGVHKIPLLVLHDFDKAGLSIYANLTGTAGWDREFQRYEYLHSFDVIDLGLRLTDVRKYQLQSEAVHYGKSDPRRNIKRNAATPEETAFLCGARRWDGWTGQRVELNAFTSADFITWIESKLKQQKIAKVIPDADTLEAAYRRAAEINYVREHVEEIRDDAAKHAEEIELPKNLERLVRQRLKKSPELPWDKVVAALVRDETE